MAATVKGGGKRWGVYDESLTQWKLGGTPALPEGTTIFAWGDEARANEITAAGYPVVVMPYKYT